MVQALTRFVENAEPERELVALSATVVEKMTMATRCDAVDGGGE